MSKVPQANVVGVFSDPIAAEEAAQSLRDEGFNKNRVGVMPKNDQTVVTVMADGRQAEASASLEDSGASGVQTVAR